MTTSRAALRERIEELKDGGPDKWDAGWDAALRKVLTILDAEPDVRDPETLQARAEDLWEELDCLCICQQVDVWHLCESCQRKVERIVLAFKALLEASPGEVQ